MTPQLVYNCDLADNPGLKPQYDWLIGYSLTHTDCVLVEPLWNKMNIPVTGSALMMSVTGSSQMLFVMGSAQIMTALHPEHVQLPSSLKLWTSGILPMLVEKRKGSALMNSMDLYLDWTVTSWKWKGPAFRN